MKLETGDAPKHFSRWSQNSGIVKDRHRTTLAFQKKNQHNAKGWSCIIGKANQEKFGLHVNAAELPYWSIMNEKWNNPQKKTKQLCCSVTNTNHSKSFIGEKVQ